MAGNDRGDADACIERCHLLHIDTDERGNTRKPTGIRTHPASAALACALRAPEANPPAASKLVHDASFESLQADDARRTPGAHCGVPALLASLLLHALLFALVPDLAVAPPPPPPLNVFVIAAARPEADAVRPQAPPPQRANTEIEPPPAPASPSPPPPSPAPRRPVAAEPRTPPRVVAKPAEPRLPPPAAAKAAAPLPAQAPSAEPQRPRAVDAPAAPTPGPAAKAEPVAEAPPPSRPDPEALARYGLALSKRLAAAQAYPRLARIRGWEGEVTLLLTIARKGGLVSVRVVNSSGHDVLDRDAIALVEDSGPLPPPPESIEGAELEVLVPVRYRLDAG